MFAATLHTHAEGLAFQRLAPQRQRLFKNIVQRGERYVFDFQNMVDAGNTGQRIANSRALIFIFRTNFDMIPMANDGQRLVIVLRTLRMFPVKILMKRNRTDWLLMVISGNNLMINFMATIVRWQARRGYKQKL